MIDVNQYRKLYEDAIADLFALLGNRYIDGHIPSYCRRLIKKLQHSQKILLANPEEYENHIGEHLNHLGDAAWKMLALSDRKDLPPDLCKKMEKDAWKIIIERNATLDEKKEEKIMGTKQYRTRTEFIERKNVSANGAWEIALDLGYSSDKIFSPNIVASCPAFAKRVNSSFQYAGKTPKQSILYRDNDSDEMWLVGEIAQNIMETGDTTDTDKALYGRDRYYNPMFKVLARTGLALGMQSNQYGSRGDLPIVVQTGLPERYLGDEPMLRDVIEGHHNFSLKVGDGDWIIYDFTLKPENIFVMSQPRGTLFSICTKSNGEVCPDAKFFLKSSGIILDPGFGTFDIFPINTGVVERGETFSDLGMRRVLQETSNLIKENYKVDIPVPFMQKYLETGLVRYSDMRKLISKEYNFEDLLTQSSSRVCREAIERLTGLFHLGDYNYIVVTGGTGAAWIDQIREAFKNFETLRIIEGNMNDDLAYIYSNVRGYYLYRYARLQG